MSENSQRWLKNWVKGRPVLQNLKDLKTIQEMPCILQFSWQLNGIKFHRFCKNYYSSLHFASSETFPTSLWIWTHGPSHLWFARPAASPLHHCCLLSEILIFQLLNWHLIFWISNWKPRNLLLKVVNITDIILVSWVDDFLIASMQILTPNFTIYRCIIYFNRIVTFFTAISRNFYPTYECLDVLYL